jgi:DNA-binding transcriptional MerR regulator
MSRLVTTGQAAQALGISTKTLRRYEDQGLLSTVRTVGGQRRYREEDIARLFDAETQDDDPAATDSTPHRDPPSVDADESVSANAENDGRDLQPWDRRVREERAELEVTKLRHERASIIRASREAGETRRRVEEERRQASDRGTMEEQRREAELAREKGRIDGLRGYGRSIAVLAPDTYQFKVARAMLSFVNAERFPPDLDDRLCRHQVNAAVDALLKPWRENQARECAKAGRRRKRDELVSVGWLRAFARTSGWDHRDAECARRDVDRALREEVRSAWSSADVRELVDATLADWEDG